MRRLSRLCVVSPRASLRLTLGAKTEGYVVGLPKQATAFGEAGLRVRF